MTATRVESGHGAANDLSGDDLYRKGLECSTGASETLDYVEAHKWFNLAALKGCDAARIYRKELAEQMTNAQIAKAQKAAREWLKAQAAAPARRDAAAQGAAA